jgi:hypothetical protein
MEQLIVLLKFMLKNQEAGKKRTHTRVKDLMFDVERTD